MGLFEDLGKFNKRQEAVVTAFSRIGYRVVPRKGPPCINRDTKIVYLPVVDPEAYPDVLRTIRGWIDHEMAHELYGSDKNVLKRAIAKGKKFESVFRYIEDGRVERLESRDFEGCRQNLSYLEKETLADRKKMGLTLYLAGKYGVEGVKLYKMDEWGTILGADLVEKCHKIKTCQDAYDVAQKAYKRIQDYIEAAVNDEMESEEEATEEDAEKHPTVSKEGPENKEEKKKQKKSQEADEILQDDKPENKGEDKNEDDDSAEGKDSEEQDNGHENNPESTGGPTDDNSEATDEEVPVPKDEKKSSKESNKTDNGAESDGTEDSESKEDAFESDNVSSNNEESNESDDDSSDGAGSEKDIGSSSNGEPGGNGEPSNREERVEKKLEELVSDGDLMDALLEKLNKNLEDIPYDPKTYTPYTADDEVHDLTKDWSKFHITRSWFPNLVADARGKVNVLAQKLRLELFATKMLFDRYKDRGRLDQRRLHVLGMGTSTDVFMKRTEQPELDTAITLLVDGSGSMEDQSKIRLAAQIAYLLSSTLETINIPHEVLSFTTKQYNVQEYTYDRTRPLVHFIHKSFATRLNHSIEAMNRIGGAQDCNVDGESVLWAAARLASRKEKRKVLFVLSDGKPNSNRDSEKFKVWQHLKEVVRMVSRHGIECVGIGILTADVREFYPHCVVVEDINDLVTTVYSELVKAIRGARREVR